MTKFIKDVFEKDEREIFKRCNNLLKRVHKHKTRMAILKLDMESLKAVGLYDDSFAGNMDFKSQLGYICF